VREQAQIRFSFDPEAITPPSGKRSTIGAVLMTDVQANAPATEARRRVKPDEPAAQIPIDGETRTFAQVEETRQAAEDAAHNGLGAARDAARRYAEVTKRIADDSRRTTFEVANFWRDGLAPVFAAQMDMHRSMEQLWRQFSGLEMMPAMRTAQPFASFSPGPLLGLPPTDVKETDQGYKLSVELPGLSQEDIELEIDGDLLILRGHKIQSREDARCAFRLSERVFGQFERSFPIPPDADRAAINAGFRDGLLTIEIPKQAAGPKPSPVRIQA
jgi:HSP20 family protein